MRIPISMMEVVSIALSQNFGCRKPIKNVHMPTKTVVPNFLPLEKKTIVTTSAITSGQGIITRNFLRDRMAPRRKLLTISKYIPYSSLKTLNPSLIHFIKGMSSHFGQLFNQLQSLSNSVALSGLHFEALKLVIKSQTNIIGSDVYAIIFFIITTKQEKKSPQVSSFS